MQQTENPDYQPRPLAIDEIEPKPILEDITVVIPTLGRPILEESLYWIVSGSAWPGGLVVVDQGQSAEVAELIARLQQLGINAEHVPSSQKGRAAGVNRGLERAQTPFVAVTDDDCFVDSDWLRNMYTCLKDNPESVVTGRVEAGTNEVIIVVTSLTPSIQRRPRLKFDTMSGGNMGTSQSVLARVGLFDEDPRLQTAEDGEWSYRALNAGTAIIYDPAVVVTHFGWRDESSRETQYRNYAFSQGGFYGKYLRRGDWFIAIRAVLHHIRAIRHWLKGIIIGDNELFLLGQAYLTGLLPGIVSGLRSENGR